MSKSASDITWDHNRQADSGTLPSKGRFNKMVLLDTRCRSILKILLQCDSPLTLAGIASQLAITPRMVRYSLVKVERFLKDSDLDLIKKPRYGIKIDAPRDVREGLLLQLHQTKGQSIVLSPSLRMQAILYYLLLGDEPVLVKQLEMLLNVSRVTILKDMGKVEEWLNAHNLLLIRRPNYGFKVTGDEASWREAFVHVLLGPKDERALLLLWESPNDRSRSGLDGSSGLYHLWRSFFGDLETKFFSRSIHEAQQMLNIRFTDHAHASLVLYLAIMLLRVSNYKFVKIRDEVSQQIKRQKEFRVAETIARSIEQGFQLTIPDIEIIYIAMQLSCAKITHSTLSIAGADQSPQMGKEVLELAERIVAASSPYLHPVLRVDRLLLNNLALHLYPVLNRLRFDIPIRNQLLEEGKCQYPHIFEVARMTSVVIEEKVDKPVPEDEVGFICMHLGAAIERLLPPSSQRWRILVVCGGGTATAWLLVSKLMAELPNVEIVEIMSARQLSIQHAFDSDIDAIISTIPLQIQGMPVIVVTPVLTDRDRKRIHGVLGQRVPFYGSFWGKPIVSENLALEDFITRKTICVKDEARDWSEVVDRAYEPLLRLNAIEPRYIVATKDLISSYGPYMMLLPGVAMLHAHPEDGVRQACMSLVTFRTPVFFGHPSNDPVQLAVAIGTVDKHSHLDALWQLMAVLEDQEKKQRIINASSKQEILDVLFPTPTSA